MTREEIKAARATLGLTQEALARELGCTLSCVRSWERENNRRSPGGVAVRALKLLLERQRQRGQPPVE